MPRVWDEVDRRWIEVEVCWSGALHRQDERAYTLLADGWAVKEHVLQKARPPRDAYPSARDMRRARHLVPADDLWHAYPVRYTPAEARDRAARVRSRPYKKR